MHKKLLGAQDYSVCAREGQSFLMGGHSKNLVKWSGPHFPTILMEGVGYLGQRLGAGEEGKLWACN